MPLPMYPFPPRTWITRSATFLPIAPQKSLTPSASRPLPNDDRLACARRCKHRSDQPCTGVAIGMPLHLPKCVQCRSERFPVVGVSVHYFQTASCNPTDMAARVIRSISKLRIMHKAALFSSPRYFAEPQRHQTSSAVMEARILNLSSFFARG